MRSSRHHLESAGGLDRNRPRCFRPPAVPYVVSRQLFACNRLQAKLASLQSIAKRPATGGLNCRNKGEEAREKACFTVLWCIDPRPPCSTGGGRAAQSGGYLLVDIRRRKRCGQGVRRCFQRRGR